MNSLMLGLIVEALVFTGVLLLGAVFAQIWWPR